MTNSARLHDTQTRNRPPAVAEFQRRWLEENMKGVTTENSPLTTASECNGVVQQSDEQIVTLAARGVTTDIEIMEVTPEISSKSTTNEMTFAEPADSQRDNQCDSTAIESAPSIRPSAQQQKKSTRRATSSIAQRQCTMRLRRPSTRKKPTNRYR
jgi:hypothetical protein